MLLLELFKDASINVHLPDGRVVGVMLLRSGNGKARLGFTAPDDVEIWRDEIDPLNEPPQPNRGQYSAPAVPTGGRNGSPPPESI